MKILADALAKIARFADVNHRPEPVFHQVNARLVRHFRKFFADLLGQRHETFSRKDAQAQRGFMEDGFLINTVALARCDTSWWGFSHFNGLGRLMPSR